MFGFGKKDRHGQQVRIEHRGKNLRISRTGGVSLRANAKVGKVGVTVNTKHGLRVSTKIAPGVRIASQGGRFQLIGRWKSGPFRYNLSKRGGSISVANRVGALNLTNSARSSFKAGGIQIRGKRAAGFQVTYIALMAILMTIRVAVWLLSFPILLSIDLLRRRPAANDPGAPEIQADPDLSPELLAPERAAR